jgi:single-stranded-DNA-specific exonuclease
VAFGGGDWAAELTEASGPIEVAFRPVINDFRGRRTVELQVCDWRTAALAATVAGTATAPVRVG